MFLAQTVQPCLLCLSHSHVQ